jgi:hypothetical protein
MRQDQLQIVSIPSRHPMLSQLPSILFRHSRHSPIPTQARAAALVTTCSIIIELSTKPDEIATGGIPLSSLELIWMASTHTHQPPQLYLFHGFTSRFSVPEAGELTPFQFSFLQKALCPIPFWLGFLAGISKRNGGKRSAAICLATGLFSWLFKSREHVMGVTDAESDLL